MNIFEMILLLLFFLLLKGFFSGSEIALVNSDKMHLHHRARQGDKGAALVLKLFKSPDRLLGTTLIGTNIATVVFTTVGTMWLIERFGSAGDLYAFLLFTPLLLIFGEVVPKSIFQQKSDQISPVVVFPLRFFSWLFAPLTFFFSRVARLAVRLIGGSTDTGGYMTREQIRTVVEMADRGANVDVFDRERIKRVIRFSETTVGEAMVPVAEMVAINRTRDIEDAMVLVRGRGYNRLPVYKRNVTNIIGIATLTTWDLLDPALVERSLAEFIAPVHYVSPYQTIDTLLPVLREREDHMAIVVDEFGSAVGMITIEDILEEVVGEIDVGYDFEEYLPRSRHIFEMLDEGTYLMDGRVTISLLNETLGISLPSVEFHTLGGMMMARLRHIPTVGESIEELGYRFVVEQANQRAIEKIRVETVE
ncbi:MAG: HlyC/CorC family transporter [Gammaproteobacteria bacterium]|nr:HlyC/CorC family transporter [Gammaproteobacteria bacterium]MBT3489843.1 HlyC/CorC family transporter [Gammaproteobacteria bacterium]MBT3718667.1 HlyC/CorC family transporter [Gammaproteobacteria bacterium]MBT3844739.1 HlyC/CorC family transporter [Gammaproteobacteria bacterium]MBT3893851.1 HlyC/CorC family transporter [Gammaproteobacteria bacterium]